MDLDELNRLRQKTAEFLAVIDGALGKITSIARPDFVRTVERQNENLGEVLKRAQVRFSGSSIHIKASNLDLSFLRLHSGILLTIAQEFTGKAVRFVKFGRL